MKIKSNIYIDENKFREFLYTLFKDNDDEVYIEDKSNDEYIYLKIDNIDFKEKILFDYEKQKQAMLKTILLKKYNMNNKWGGLVGVRPTKLVHSLLAENKTYYEIKYILKKIYLLSDEKIDLLLNVVKNSIKYIDKETVGLYIGLAFCPSKCTYCSFPAYLKVGKYEKYYNQYFDCLIDEIEFMGQLIEKLGLKINTIYIGGGTPSYLSYEEIERLLSTVNKNCNLKYLEEFTLEAGRIDSIDEEKLNIMKKYKVNRISINPQSFKDETLKIVNRYHDIDKLNEVYKIAKSLGFIINMDFILSLPKETTQDMLDTINKIYDYDVENITIHNLSLKNASYLTKQKYLANHVDFDKIYNAIYKLAKDKNYVVYYMYRQKNSNINGENLGFCKDGYQSRYNIDMIEENKNIFSVGAGSYTKLISKNGIQRIVFPKDPIVYVREYEQRKEKKKREILKFYEKI